MQVTKAYEPEMFCNQVVMDSAVCLLETNLPLLNNIAKSLYIQQRQMYIVTLQHVLKWVTHMYTHNSLMHTAIAAA